VLRSLNLASSYLDHLLATSSGYSEADLALRLIVREVEAAAARAPDVAIASILRNQPARAKLERARRRECRRPGRAVAALQGMQACGQIPLRTSGGKCVLAPRRSLDTRGVKTILT
jgi:hypothetical protein